MTTETLTDEERLALQCGTALRDALLKERDAEIARAWEEVSRVQQVGLRLESEVARLTAQCEGLNAALDTAEKRYVELSAEVARLTAERDEARVMNYQASLRVGAPYPRSKVSEAEVARLTSERDEARAERDVAEVHERELRALQLEHEAEVARLTKALAAGREMRDGLELERRDAMKRAEAAEQKLAEAERVRLEHARRSLEAQAARDAAKARVRDLQRNMNALVEAHSERGSELAQLRERVAKAVSLLERDSEIHNPNMKRDALEALRGK